MEKLETKRKTNGTVANKKLSKKIQKKDYDFNQKKVSKLKQKINSIFSSSKIKNFKQNFIKNWKTITYIFFQFLLVTILIFFALFNNKYFLFLNMPKFLYKSNILCFLSIFCLFLINFLPILLIFIKKPNFDNSEIKNNFYKECIQNKIKNSGENNLKNNKNKCKNFEIKNDIKSNIKFAIFSSILFCIFCIGFFTKCIWICVFVMFILFASSFIMLFKQKSKYLLWVNAVAMLFIFLLLLSVYYVYLLN